VGSAKVFQRAGGLRERDWHLHLATMALVAGRFGVAAAAAAPALESRSSNALGQAAPAELVRIGISARRPCTSIGAASKCFLTAPSVVMRPTRCRAVATNYLEEEPEVLDAKEEEEEVEEEVSPLTPSAFEVQI